MLTGEHALCMLCPAKDSCFQESLKRCINCMHCSWKVSQDLNRSMGNIPGALCMPGTGDAVHSTPPHFLPHGTPLPLQAHLTAGIRC